MTSVGLTMVLVASLLIVGPQQATATGVVTTYTHASMDFPAGIALGPDGAMWFTNANNDSIGRITTGAVPAVTNYTHSSIDRPTGIALGPDGAMWFTNLGGDSIGRITTGGVPIITSYNHLSIDHPDGIAAGPDGAMWFTNTVADHHSIGRISTDGNATITSYDDETPGGAAGITLGPDGAMWFADLHGDSVGRISTDGLATVTHFSAGVPADCGMSRIVAGPDDDLWFTCANFDINSVGRITTGGVVTNHTGIGVRGPFGIALGPDNNLWFTNLDNDTIGRITTDGLATVTNYAHPSIDDSLGIAAGSDGAMWFTNEHNDSIGRITTTGPGPVTVQTSSVPSSRVAVSYSRTLAVSGGIAPYSWTKLSGSLPPGLSLSPGGVISGVPTTLGTYPFVVRVSDADSPAQSATKALSITITNNFRIITPDLHSGTRGQPYSRTLAAAGGTLPYKWKKIGKLPRGLKLKAKTGVLSGTPTKAGTFTLKVQVTDKRRPRPGLVATKTFTIVVT